MCIILHKPTGATMPDETALESYFVDNPDGAGLMYTNKKGKNVNKLRIHKGFMKFESLVECIRQLKLSERENVAIHFRRRTSGEKNAANTHPFPITNRTEIFELSSWEGEIPAIMHNGTVGKGESGLSDTAVFVRDTLADPYIYDGIIENNEKCFTYIKKLLKKGRLIIMYPNGLTHRLGNWHLYDGVYYSREL